jgi:hypothetical protein
LWEGSNWSDTKSERGGGHWKKRKEKEKKKKYEVQRVPWA